MRNLILQIDEISDLAQRFSQHVFCFTETWLEKTILDHEIKVKNYTCAHKDRKRQDGGVSMYICNDVVFDVKNDICNDLEVMWVNILHPKTKPILPDTCYRPPDQNNFYILLEETCIKVNKLTSMEVILTRDFNTNISSVKVNALRFICMLTDLHQIIAKSSTVCNSSQSVIYLILV